MPVKSSKKAQPKNRNQWYGYIPDLPDKRDYVFAVSQAITEAAQQPPPSIDLRTSGLFPPIYDQGQLGSCTANAIAAAWEYEHQKQATADHPTRQFFNPSRLFIYYDERVMEGSTSEDAGAMIRDGIKSIARQGLTSEKRWPYQISRFADKPTPACYKDALNHVSLKYQRVRQSPTAVEMKQALAIARAPVIVGFSVYTSFESSAVEQTGHVPMPNVQNEDLLGGHAVLVVGYDDNNDGGRFICRNSWGEDWGDNGHFTMPYEYLMDPDLAEDFWIIQKTKG